jgi:hypothetical protein
MPPRVLETTVEAAGLRALHKRERREGSCGPSPPDATFALGTTIDKLNPSNEY